MTGSHIDTVATGGLYDGNLGVLAGLEIVQSLNEASIETVILWLWLFSPTKRALVFLT